MNISEYFDRYFKGNKVDEVVEELSNEELEPILSSNSSTYFEWCKRLVPKFNSEEGNEGKGIHLTHVFPDSGLCILKDATIGYYFVASIDEEKLITLPIIKYRVLVAARQGIILEFINIDNKREIIYTDGNTAQSLTSLRFDKVDGEPSCLTMVSNELTIDLNLQTSELAPLTYESGKYVLTESEISYELGEDKVILANTEIGSLFGFKLNPNKEGLVEINHKRYFLYSRPTLALLILIEESTGEEWLLLRKLNSLVKLSEVSDLSASELEIINGVPILIKALQFGAEMTILTNRMVQLNLSSVRVPLSDKVVGNGVYIKTEGVLLLNSSVHRVLRKKGKKYLLTGKPVKLPMGYMGENYGLSISSIEEATEKSKLLSKDSRQSKE